MSYDNIIEQFIEAMAAAGCAPDARVSIVADDKRHRYRISGERNENGSYQLKISDNFGVGWFHNFKGGETHKWHSKTTGRKMTAEERAAIKVRIAEEQKIKDAQQATAELAAQTRAVGFWERARPPAPGWVHPYLARKQIAPHGVRFYKNIILVPVYIGRDLWSVQFITEEGEKRFIKDGRLKGGYAPVAHGDDDKSTVIICEGWATGVSLRQATGFPVVVAFNAGNLEGAARAMRLKYPDARLIIAADNDQWSFAPKKRPAGVDPKELAGDDPRWLDWRIAGALYNTGLEKAKQAAIKVGAHVVWPDISENDPEKRTDFNDIHCSEGLDAVRNRILAAAPANQPPVRGDITQPDAIPFAQPGDIAPPLLEGPPADWDEIPHSAYESEFGALYEAPRGPQNDRWREGLSCKEDGTPKGNSLNNARLILENHADYKGLICYDEFAHDKIMTRCPPWDENKKAFVPRALRDEDVTGLAMHLEKFPVSLALPTLRKVLETVIMKEARNPAREYFSRLKWDGVPRLDTWLRDYCGCKRDDDEYLAAIGRKWLTAAVARVFEPGCKFDHILIFEGRQNLGKSIMLRELATIHGKSYFDDTIKANDLLHEKVVPKLRGVLIIELAEMTGFQKMDKNAAKQIFSTTYDRIVPKYANEPVSYPRQFIFAGSWNPKQNDGYLDDPTGDRRYWPAYCTRIDIEAVRRDKEQLWAEAVSLYQGGEKIWLENELYDKAVGAQRLRNMTHPWQPEIEEFCRLRDMVTVREIWESMAILDRSKRTRQASEDISKIMVNIGYEYKRPSVNGERIYAWVRTQPEVKQEPEEEIIWS